MIFYCGEVACGRLNGTWIAFGLHAGVIASEVPEARLGRNTVRHDALYVSASARVAASFGIVGQVRTDLVALVKGLPFVIVIRSNGVASLCVISPRTFSPQAIRAA